MGAGLIYGLVGRFVFIRGGAMSNDGTRLVIYGLMTIAFIFLVPVALGVLTVYFAETEKRRSWWFRLFFPWIPSFALLVVAWLVGWEGSICLLMASPIFLIMASVGGAVSTLATGPRRSKASRFSGLALILAMPYVAAPIESQIPWPQSVREVKTQITIHADPATVWRNIERVPSIAPSEQGFSFFHLLGFPRPVEATLSREGEGGVRHATFEGGVLFVETITEWKPQEALTFDIKAETSSIPPTTLDEHVTIGGPYFDVLEGSYKIEPGQGGSTVLHLSSVHRLSTRFNFYSGVWTDFIMRDIQNNILGIIKRRCEEGSLQSARSF